MTFLKKTIFAGSPPTPLVNKEVPVLLKTLGKGLPMQVIDCVAYIFVQHESLEPGGSSQQYQMHLFNLIHPFSRWWSPTVPDASRDAPAAAAAANSLHLPCASGLASSCTIIFTAEKLYLHNFAIVYTY